MSSSSVLISSKYVSLALELGATDAVIEVYNGLTRMVRFSNNEVTVVKEMMYEKASIYVSIREKRAILEVNSTSPSAIKKAVRDKFLDEQGGFLDKYL